MVCERCGEIGETFMTEHDGEFYEAYQKLVEQEQQQKPRQPRVPEEA